MEKAKKFLRKPAIQVTAAAILAAIAIPALLAAAKRGTGHEKEETGNAAVAYEYTAEEQELAEAVEAYLAEFITLDDTKSMEAADTAVHSYRAILESGIKNVSSEHTKALSRRMRDALEKAAGERVTDEGLDALADGTCGVIWDFILAHMEDGPPTENGEEFTQLSESLQEQIDELKDRNLSVKISANIKDRGISREELESREQGLWSQLSQVGDDILGMKDSILREVDSRLGNTKPGENGKDGKDGANGVNGKDGTDGHNGANGRDGKDGEDGRDGRAGADGKDGADGKNGKDGEDGKDGADGESTYIMFSEYPGGRDAAGTVSMSAMQGNRTKYMGTAHTSAGTAPEDPESYTWSEYKDYIIFSGTDENGVPTVYIQ